MSEGESTFRVLKPPFTVTFEVTPDGRWKATLECPGSVDHVYMGIVMIAYDTSPEGCFARLRLAAELDAREAGL